MFEGDVSVTGASLLFISGSSSSTTANTEAPRVILGAMLGFAVVEAPMIANG